MNGLNPTSFILSAKCWAFSRIYIYKHVEREWNEWYEGISSKIAGHFANDMQNRDIILNVEQGPGRREKIQVVGLR